MVIDTTTINQLSGQELDQLFEQLLHIVGDDERHELQSDLSDLALDYEQQCMLIAKESQSCSN